MVDPYLRLYLPLYKLDGDVISDRSAYGHKCTVAGAPLESARGMRFNGVDDAIDLGDDRFDSLTEGTIIIWIKFVALSAQRFFSFDVSSTDRTMFTKGSDETLFFIHRTGNVNRLTINSNDTLSLNHWYFFAYSSGVASNALYINGNPNLITRSDGDATTHAFFDDMASGTTLYKLGKRTFNSEEFANCTIGEFSIYSRVLPAIEIQRIYQQTKWRYR